MLENTLFSSSKIPLIKKLLIIKLWCTKIKLSAISEITKVSKQSINKVMKRLYKTLELNFEEHQDKIGGERIIVEVDESKFGKVKYNKGHRVDEVWIFGMVEKTIARKIVLAKVDNRKKETLEELALKYINCGSIIHSDCWKAYNNFKNIFAEHLKVNHSQNFVCPITKTHTNTIEGNWYGVKNQIENTHRKKKFITPYLIRYMLRRNFKDDIFKEVLKMLLIKS
ncbi:hypothetical protein H311_03061 [Anncaliia algerae PRA109]|nr:hypothetical protein H311_03061 [Anncaliia algerae PRA109]